MSGSVVVGAEAPPRRSSPLRIGPAAVAATPPATLGQANEALCRACRNQRLQDAVAAAAAARPMADPHSACATLLRDIAGLRPAPPAMPDDGQVWLLRRFDGSMLGLYRLRENGLVGIDPHPNESRWALRDGQLKLGDPSGRVTTSFPISGTDAAGRRVHIGLFYDGRTLHVLSEVNCSYSQLRMLDPELVGAFAGHFRPDQLAQPALPPRPALLLAAPRTGSHLLLNLLNSSGRVFFDAELMNAAHISLFGGDIAHEDAGALYTLRSNDPVHFVKVMLGRSHNTDGCTLDDVAVRGFKLFPQQSHKVLDWAIDEPGVRIVHLHRANLLAEFSSLLVAYAEGHWVGGPRSLQRRRIHFDSARFARFVGMKQRYLDGVRERLARRAGAAMEIEYSSISHAAVNGVLSFLHGQPSSVGLDTLGLKRQLGSSVVERFENADDVRRSLQAMRQEAWAEPEEPLSADPTGC